MPVSPIIVTVVSSKGGVGKTTSCANVGGLLADLGLKVLLIDADPQPQLTKYFANHGFAPQGLTEIIRLDRDVVLTSDCITSLIIPDPEYQNGFPSELMGRLDLVQSNSPGNKLVESLQNKADRAYRLKTPLQNQAIFKSYDVVLIDTQGAYGPLQDAAIYAADILISPVPCDSLSAREFCSGTISMIKKLDSGILPGLSVPPIKALIYKQERTSVSQMYAKEIRETFSQTDSEVQVLETVVPHATAYQKAANERVPVHWIDRDQASQTMHQLVWEIFPHLKGQWASVPAKKGGKA
jgi:chromosome partitioning related protein ParA